MELAEALSIVHTLAVAARAMAETGKNVTEAKIDEAIEMVGARVKVLQTMSSRPKR